MARRRPLPPLLPGTDPDAFATARSAAQDHATAPGRRGARGRRPRPRARRTGAAPGSAAPLRRGIRRRAGREFDLARAAGQPACLPRAPERGRRAAGGHRRPQPPADRRRTRPADAGQPRDQVARAAGRQLPRAGIEGRRTARAARDGRTGRPSRPHCRARRGRRPDSMTGAAAMSLASASPAPPPAARGAVRSDNTAQPPADADAPDAAAGAGRGKDADRAARPGERAEDAPPAPAPSFAQLLTQAPPPPAPAPAPPPEAPAAGTESGASSPGQLLALLDGSWSGAGPAANVAAATTTTTFTGAQPSTDLSAAASVTAAATAAQPEPGAEHALLLVAEGDAASTLAASPALEAAAIARDASAATQAAPAIEAPTAGITGTTPLATASRPQAAPALPPLPMPANPDAGFDESFGTRLVWMAEQRVGHAEIRLNPEHVGPIEVRVQLDG